jgi:uncharacterized protein (DUF608 family)
MPKLFKVLLVLLSIMELIMIEGCKKYQTGNNRYNPVYLGDRLNRIAFPMGGMGAGMICLEGTGALSHFSLHHSPEVFNEPGIFSAICIKNKKGAIAKVLESPVPAWKIYGKPQAANGKSGITYGLPRFSKSEFKSRFPFGTVTLRHKDIPLKISITGWSPFIPGDAGSASLPVAALEYVFKNKSKKRVEAVYSFNALNFMVKKDEKGRVSPINKGFILRGPGDRTAFCAQVNAPGIKVNCAWFRGGWFDAMTMAWQDVEKARSVNRPPHETGEPGPGASLSVSLSLKPGETKTIGLMFSWHVPGSDTRDSQCCCSDNESCSTYEPWYTSKFADIRETADYWKKHYNQLREKSRAFCGAFYSSTLPPEVLEAVSANLSILKSPTVMRQADGRLWCWEGCDDEVGCCEGSCTHVWNYAQALPSLFPDLERTLRETEFNESQDGRGHQDFRAALPIGPTKHKFHAAADGQLGGIMKAYREWRISGNTEWLKNLWPKIKKSLDFCIGTWDPDHRGILEQPHHNTYDIEFYGPDGMCTSFYLGALKAASLMGQALNDTVPLYESLLHKGKKNLEGGLFNGEYFYQKVRWDKEGANSPMANQAEWNVDYSAPEARTLLKKEGPKYQYGKGCLSDGIIGAWMGKVCGLPEFIDVKKVRCHLESVHKYNFKKDLSDHANPQRPTYALGKEGGLLLCTWPRGGELSLPFVYSNEVWTGIEYQVATHLIMEGMIEQGLEIVRACRDRYDGRVRNPFDEYECGHWYARAMASYALIQALTGFRYDAVEKTLCLAPKIKQKKMVSFFSTAVGFGNFELSGKTLKVKIIHGKLAVAKLSITLNRKTKEILIDKTVTAGKAITVKI